MKDISTSGYATVPAVGLVWIKTDTGLDVLKPVKGDQCWDSQLPCTNRLPTDVLNPKRRALMFHENPDEKPPRFNEILRLREDKIESGFTVVPPGR